MQLCRSLYPKRRACCGQALLAHNDASGVEHLRIALLDQAAKGQFATRVLAKHHGNGLTAPRAKKAVVERTQDRALIPFYLLLAKGVLQRLDAIESRKELQHLRVATPSGPVLHVDKRVQPEERPVEAPSDRRRRQLREARENRLNDVIHVDDLVPL